MAGVEELEAQKRKPNFGNAGAVNNLLSSGAERMELRLKVCGSVGRIVVPGSGEGTGTTHEAASSNCFTPLHGIPNPYVGADEKRGNLCLSTKGWEILNRIVCSIRLHIL